MAIKITLIGMKFDNYKMKELLLAHILIPMLTALARAATSMFIFLILLAINPTLACSVIFFLGGLYAGIYFWIRKELERIGKDRYLAEQKLFKTSAEIFGGIKER